MHFWVDKASLITYVKYNSEFDQLIVATSNYKLFLYNLSVNGSKVKGWRFDVEMSGEIVKVEFLKEGSLIALEKTNELKMIDLGTKEIKVVENVKWFEVIWGWTLVVDTGDMMRVHDGEDFDNGHYERKLGVERISSVFRNGKNSIFVFYDEFFNLNVYDFEGEIKRENLEKFDYIKVTKFEEISTPSEAFIDGEVARYWTTRVNGTDFCFICWNFSESAEILYKTYEDQWALAKPEEQDIQILPPSDSNTHVSSFRGIINYPFWLTPDEKDTWSYKFTDADITVGYPRRIITLSYTGRIDIYEVYFKNIEKNQNEKPDLSKSNELDNEESKLVPNNLEDSENHQIKESEVKEKLESDSKNNNMLESLKIGDEKTKISPDANGENKIDKPDTGFLLGWKSDKKDDKSKTNLFSKEANTDDSKLKVNTFDIPKETKPSLFGTTEIKLNPFGLTEPKPSLFGTTETKPSTFGSTDTKPNPFGISHQGNETSGVFGSKSKDKTDQEKFDFTSSLTSDKSKLNNPFNNNGSKTNFFDSKGKDATPAFLSSQNKPKMTTTGLWNSTTSNITPLSEKKTGFAIKVKEEPPKPDEEEEKEEKIGEEDIEEQISEEDKEAIKAAAQKDFLDSIKDKFHKLFLTIEYELSNQINSVFSDFKDIKIDCEFTSKEYKKQILDFQDQLERFYYNLTNQQEYQGELADKISYYQQIKENIKEFWEVAKKSETESHQETRK